MKNLKHNTKLFILTIMGSLLVTPIFIANLTICYFGSRMFFDYCWEISPFLGLISAISIVIVVICIIYELIYTLFDQITWISMMFDKYWRK
jgi:hypothetical protein